MTKTALLIIGISVLVSLLVIFVVSFILYVHTPAPKGCEDIKISDDKCASCSNNECRFYPNKNEEGK